MADFVSSGSISAEMEKQGVIMNIADIKKIAKKVGVESAKLKKGELIQAIQKAEGNTPCFGSGIPDCPYPKCCWREDCVA